MPVPASTVDYSGSLYYGTRTKRLVQHVPDGCFLLVDHEDIDEIAALSIVDRKVSAVINVACSMTGKYPSNGTYALLKAGIPVFDIVQRGDSLPLQECKHGLWVLIRDDQLWIQNEQSWTFGGHLFQYDMPTVQERLQQSNANEQHYLKAFTRNTLDYAWLEMEDIFAEQEVPQLSFSLQDRYVIVVTRGNRYIDDLSAIRHFIESYQPVLIGVDGGADAITECGHVPDVIIGDMDSVSAETLCCGAELVVHAYKNGYGPGVDRVQSLGLAYHLFSCVGLSEDAACLFAYESGAKQIVTVGSHTSMLDFMQKGRPGMGSTLLMRLKLGNKLLDIKGISMFMHASPPLEVYRQ